jgi:hypothetical protein
MTKSRIGRYVEFWKYLDCYLVRSKVILDTAVCNANGRVATRNITMYVQTGLRDIRIFTPGNMKISCEPLVNPQDVHLRHLHIKPELMKNFVKAHDREGHAYAYLRNRFPKLSEAEVKKRIFFGPLIRGFIHDLELRRTLSFEAAWNTFNLVCTKFIAEN